MATANWSAASTRTTGIAAESVAAGANFLGSEIDNSSNKDRWLDLEMLLDATGGTPDADEIAEVYILYCPDGTNYEDGDASTDPAKEPVAYFRTQNDADAQRVVKTRIPLSPHKFKLLLKSDLSVTTDFTVAAYTYNEVTS